MEMSDADAYALMSLGADGDTRPFVARARAAAGSARTPVSTIAQGRGYTAAEVKLMIGQATAQLQAQLRQLHAQLQARHSVANLGAWQNAVAQRDEQIRVLKQRLSAMQSSATYDRPQPAGAGMPPTSPPSPVSLVPDMDPDPEGMEPLTPVPGPGPDSKPMTREEAAIFYGGADDPFEP